MFSSMGAKLGGRTVEVDEDEVGEDVDEDEEDDGEGEEGGYGWSDDCELFGRGVDVE